MNAASINIPSNFIASCQNTLKRYSAAKSDAERRAVLDRQTVQGLWWAIGFVSVLSVPRLHRASASALPTLSRFLQAPPVSLRCCAWMIPTKRPFWNG